MEKSWLWTTGTSGDGASTYTQADTSEFMKIAAACFGFEGVAPSYLSAFAATTAANTANIGTGGAMVDGKPYKNDATLPVTIPSPVTNNRIDRIVLRASWASYQVRITRIPGTEAVSPVAPAITQTSGTTYDIQLYQALVTPAGAVTLTDERTLARAQTAGIAPAAITQALIASGAVGLLNLDPSLRVQKIGQVNGNGTGIVSIASIPTSFSHLLVIASARNTLATAGSAPLDIRVNGDATGGNYSARGIQTLGSTVITFNSSGYTAVGAANIGGCVNTGYSSTDLTANLILLPNYQNGASKTMISLTGDVTGVSIGSGRWLGAAAINQLSFFADNGSGTLAYLTTDSVVSLYGIN